MLHESKCRNLHGHRYVVELTVQAESLDSLGRVIDFSALKGIVGAWIDEQWDHGFIGHEDDTALVEMCRREGWKVYTIPGNPTAENMALYLREMAQELLARADTGIDVSSVRLYETPNCWADA